jgi:hypothetical protein
VIRKINNEGQVFQFSGEAGLHKVTGFGWYIHLKIGATSGYYLHKDGIIRVSTENSKGEQTGYFEDKSEADKRLHDFLNISGCYVK